MALFDKVKQQASQVAAKAQEAGKAGQQKLADAQAKRKADGMLRELGLAAYSEKAGRGTDATKADIDRLVGELSAYEADNGSLADDAAPGAPASDTAPPAAAPTTDTAPPATSGDDEPLPGGGFTL